MKRCFVLWSTSNIFEVKSSAKDDNILKWLENQVLILFFLSAVAKCVLGNWK